MIEVNKTLIVGCPGSGKSFLSNKLGKLTGVEVYHLDDLYWEEGWKEKAPEDWIKVQKELVNKDKFIIDGNYLKNLEFRIKYSETIIYMDKGLMKCLFGFAKRTMKNLIGKDVDLPKKVKEQKGYRITENGFFDFCKFIIKFHSSQKKELNELLSKYKMSKSIIILRNKNEVSEFLKDFSEEK